MFEDGTQEVFIPVKIKVFKLTLNSPPDPWQEGHFGNTSSWGTRGRVFLPGQGDEKELRGAAQSGSQGACRRSRELTRW